MKIDYETIFKTLTKLFEITSPQKKKIESFFHFIIEQILQHYNFEIGLFCTETDIPTIPSNLIITSPQIEPHIKKTIESFFKNNQATLFKGIKETKTLTRKEIGKTPFDILRDIGAYRVIIIPIREKHSLYGNVTIISLSPPKKLTKKSLEKIELLTAIIGRLINRIEVYRNLKLLERAIDASLTMTPALLNTLTLNDILSHILKTALKLAPADMAHIFLYENKTLTFGAMLNPKGELTKPFSMPRENGLTYTVARTGTPIIVPDIKKHKLFKDTPASWKGAIVGLPLKIGNRVVGVMNISRKKTGYFSQRELRIWKLFSNHAAALIENAKLIESEREKNKLSEALKTAVATINSSLDLSDVLDNILNEIRRVVSYDSASIMFLEHDTAHVIAGKDLPGVNAIGHRYTITPLDLEIIKTKKPIVLADARTNPHFKAWGNTSYVRGWMAIPLISDNEVIGLITIDSKKTGAYSEKDAEIAMSFAHYAAIALKNAMLHKRLREKVDALKEYQARLVQHEKLVAVGKLVAGVAHELNNPLTSIMGISQILLAETTNPETAKLLQQLLHETERTARIVKNLLDFAREQKADKEIADINEILNSTIESLERELKESNITIVKSFSQSLPKIYGDPYKLQQVFTNIIINAKQAIESIEKQNGEIVIHTTFDKSLYQEIDIDKQENTKMIRVSIRDNGPGIPENILPHIFDPFFTTKKTGKGTGLGLSVCHGIIIEHNGHIWAESTKSGTTFFVELPHAKPHTTHDSEKQPSQSIYLDTIEKHRKNTDHSATKILIVEDETNIRAVVSKYLEKRGYKTKTASNGREAVDILLKEDFDIIICDLRMPDIDGYKLYELITDIKPTLSRNFIVITGDTVSNQTKAFIEKNNLPYLAKPFNMEDILQLVEEIE